METLTKSTVVNFLRTDKCIDWRYATSDSMSNKDTKGVTTIYWIGVIELESIDEEQRECPIHFITHHGDLKEDREYTRDADGAQRGITTVLYDLNGLLPVLIIAKKMRSKYVHILIEEHVQASGALTANALVSEDTKVANVLSKTGFQSDKPWIELETLYTLHLSSVDISNLKRIPIRHARSYNWMK